MQRFNLGHAKSVDLKWMSLTALIAGAGRGHVALA